MTESIKIVAVTGANSGIGLDIIKAYLAAGHKVAAFSRSVEQCEALAQQYPQSLIYKKGLVENAQDLESFYQQISDTWQGLDILVANAGIAHAEAISEVTEESFENTLNINVKGVFFTVQKALPVLNKHASITLISSIQANRGAGVWAAYGASKAAVRSLARSFAAELGAQGVRVNCLSPGVTQTPIFDKFGIDRGVLDESLVQIKDATPLKRLGEVADITNAVMYLNSELAAFITGADLQVDGGLAQI
ncbi:SDR family oxidoreductase [uncultured Paraglaciecola sp.]|uniref:SDR family NAD(P)-dependent oxidoreductase n=1 Tax=uncultured Paraglaciecola sp. TaxID=1765024 RepID=UPI002591F0C0|nr:SDR family oxidoreductase [uncultured Paraglaciecola sp.]